MDKEQQKKLITEIMDLDAKDGLYDTVNDTVKITIKKDSEAAKAFESLREDKQEFKENVQSGKIMPPHIKEKIDKLTGELKKVYELAEQSWEGCDGCNENDKYFFMKGFQAGYNRATPDELSDDEKNDEYLLKCLTIFSNKLLESEQSKNDGIPRLMYKDGREIRSYHSPKLDNILKEISDEEALRLAKEMNKQPLTFVPAEISDEEMEKAAANLANPNADKTDNWKEGYLYAKEQLELLLTNVLDHLCDKMESISQEQIDKDNFQLARYRTFKYIFEYIQSLKQPKQ